MDSHVIMFHDVSCCRSSCTVMTRNSMSCPSLSCHDVNTHSVSCRLILHDVTTSLVMSGDTTRLNVTFHDIIHCITDQNVSTDAAPIPDMSHHAGPPLARSMMLFDGRCFIGKLGSCQANVALQSRQELGESARRVRGSATISKNKCI